MIDKWDRRFLRIAKEVSKWSKDPNWQIGAVAVIDRRILLITLDVAIPQRVDGAAKKAIEDFAKATNDFDPRKELFSKAKK